MYPEFVLNMNPDFTTTLLYSMNGFNSLYLLLLKTSKRLDLVFSLLLILMAQ